MSQKERKKEKKIVLLIVQLFDIPENRIESAE